MLNQIQALQRLIEKIEAAPIDPLPSDNIYLEDVFEPELYSEIISSLPSNEDYDFIEHPDAVLPNGRRTRKLMDLTEETLARLSPDRQAFWREMRELMTSPLLLAALMYKFHRKAFERFGAGLPPLIATPVFYRDFPGYRISIHPDTPVKIATLQFYFPKDDSQRHLGTSFHIREGNSFRRHKTNDFKPNSAYAFFRTDYSWHSVTQMGENESVRDTLALTVYEKGKEYRSQKRYI